MRRCGTIREARPKSKIIAEREIGLQVLTRLALGGGVNAVIAEGLDLLGVSTPHSMSGLAQK